MNFLRQFFRRYKSTLELIRECISIKTDTQVHNFLIERFAIQLVVLWLLDSLGAWKTNLITNFKQSIEKNTNYYSEFILPLLKTLKNEQFLLVTTEELELIEARNELFYNINSNNFDNDRLSIFKLLESYSWSIDEKDTEKRVEILTPYVLSYLYEMSISRGTTGTVYTPPFIADYITKTALQKLSKNVNNKAKSLAELAVLDPAMGTGNFIMAALFALEELYLKNRKQSNLNVKSDLSSIRKKIITNQLYGIDLDPYAVKICILRLFFALISTKTNRENVNLQHIYFETNFFIDDALLMLNSDYSLNKNKWDLILMNPPYIRVKNIPSNKKNLYAQFYRTAYGAYDLSILFIELALTLLNKNGVLGCITSNKWLIADFGKKLRKEILTEYAIVEIVDCSSIQIFENVQIATVMFFIQNKLNKEPVLIKRTQKLSELNQLQNIAGVYIKTSELISKDDKYRIHIFNKKRTYELLSQIEKSAIKLEKIADIRTGIMGFNYWGISDYVYDAKRSSASIKFLTNSLIEQYRNLWSEKSIKIYGRKYKAPYIDTSCNIITEATRKFFKQQKIVVRGIGKKLTAYVDNEGVALSVAVHGIVTNHKISPYYLTALLNSPIIDWYHKTKWYTARIPEGSLRYPISFLRTIPIKIDENQFVIAELSKILHEIAKSKNKTIFQQLKKLIDAVIFNVYLDLQFFNLRNLKKHMLKELTTLKLPNDKTDALLSKKSIVKFVEETYANPFVRQIIEKKSMDSLEE